MESARASRIQDRPLTERQGTRSAAGDAVPRPRTGHPVEQFRCRSCHKDIEKERLELVPWSLMCAACAQGPQGAR